MDTHTSPRPAKPHLRRITMPDTDVLPGSRWWQVEGSGCTGLGFTEEQAYEDWLAHLFERASQQQNNSTLSDLWVQFCIACSDNRDTDARALWPKVQALLDCGALGQTEQRVRL